MLIRSVLASAVLAALVAGCTQTEAPARAAINDKTYAVTPDAMTVKAGALSGEFTEMKIVERVEEGSGRIDQPARLTGKLSLKNVSPDQSVRVLGGRFVYIDTEGKPIPLEDKRVEPTLKVSSSYGSPERLDPGQDSSQPVEAEFPVAALKAKRLKEIRLELQYIPSTFRQETMSFGVAVGG